MTRLIPALLLLAACTNEPPELGSLGYQDKADVAWETLWELLDEQYDTGRSRCYYAIDDTAVVVSNKAALDLIGCDNAVGCTVHAFPPGVPTGAFTIGLLEGAGHGVNCYTLLHELVHVADHCLARNHEGWPFPGGGHPFALFAGNEPSVLSEFEDRAWGECRNG